MKNYELSQEEKNKRQHKSDDIHQFLYIIYPLTSIDQIKQVQRNNSSSRGSNCWIIQTKFVPRSSFPFNTHPSLNTTLNSPQDTTKNIKICDILVANLCEIAQLNKQNNNIKINTVLLNKYSTDLFNDSISTKWKMKRNETFNCFYGLIIENEWAGLGALCWLFWVSRKALWVILIERDEFWSVFIKIIIMFSKFPMLVSAFLILNTISMAIYDKFLLILKDSY